jgi:hypothetical protein
VRAAGQRARRGRLGQPDAVAVNSDGLPMARYAPAVRLPSGLRPETTTVSVPGRHRMNTLSGVPAGPVTASFSTRKKPGGAIAGSPGATATTGLLPAPAPGATVTWTSSRSAVRADTDGSPMTPTSLTSQAGPDSHPLNSELTPTTLVAPCTFAATARAIPSRPAFPLVLVNGAGNTSPPPTR